MPATSTPHHRALSRSRALELAKIVEHLYFAGWSFWSATARVVYLDQDLDR